MIDTKPRTPYDFGMTTSMEESLRAAIRKRSETESVHAIAQGSGVNHAAIYRFLTGDRGLKFESVAKLCQYLGLALCEEAAAKPPAKRKQTTKG